MRHSFFAVALVLMMAVCMMPVLADDDTNQGIIQNGKGNTAYQVGDDAFIHVDKAYVKEDVNAPTTVHNDVTYEAPEQGPTTSYLSTGDVSWTRLVYPNRIAVIPIDKNWSEVSVKSGTVVALYTIDSEYYNTVQGLQAIPDYNEFYDRMDHNSAVWMSWIPYYTTSETIGIPEGADYLVIDNRNKFTSYNLITITPHPIEDKESY